MVPIDKFLNNMTGKDTFSMQFNITSWCNDL